MPQIMKLPVKDVESKWVTHADFIREKLGHLPKLHKMRRQIDRSILKVFFDVGRSLHEIRGEIPHGDWGDWLKTEFKLSARQAQRYMEFAKSDVTSLLSGELDAAKLELVQKVWRRISGNEKRTGRGAVSEEKQAHSPPRDTIEQHPRSVRSSSSAQRSEPAPRVTNRVVSDELSRLAERPSQDEVTTEEVEYQEEQSENGAPDVGIHEAHHRETDVADEQAPSQDGPEVIELSLWEEERDEVYLLAGDLQAAWGLPSMSDVLLEALRFAHRYVGPAVGEVSDAE
ncbi:Uncharacterized protein (Fragment) OS=Desulfitobacterium hafniense DP7 GN=HMPREF0322_03862 PE=4 SV=1: DUF3102 [Gemmataceae bacterium]